VSGCLATLHVSWLAECLLCSSLERLIVDFGVRLIDLVVILQLGWSAFR